MNKNIIPFPLPASEEGKQIQNDPNTQICLNEFAKMYTLLQSTLAEIVQTENAVRSGNIDKMIEVRELVIERLNKKNRTNKPRFD